MENVDPELACPRCGAANERATAGITLENPVGCHEEAMLVECSGCGSFYFEVEESGSSHPDGPAYYTHGPLHPKLAKLVLERIRECPAPFATSQVFCPCLGHRFVANVLYAPWQQPLDPGDPWAKEEEIKARLEGLWGPRL